MSLCVTYFQSRKFCSIISSVTYDACLRNCAIEKCFDIITGNVHEGYVHRTRLPLISSIPHNDRASLDYILYRAKVVSKPTRADVLQRDTLDLITVINSTIQNNIRAAQSLTI